MIWYLKKENTPDVEKKNQNINQVRMKSIEIWKILDGN